MIAGMGLVIGPIIRINSLIIKFHYQVLISGHTHLINDLANESVEITNYNECI